MTDEEKARDYALARQKNLHLSQRDTNLIQLAYLHGLKAGRPQWHDLRKNPNDVPNDERYVWTNVGPGHYDADGIWWDDFGRLQGVIAWCEPEFEKEDKAQKILGELAFTENALNNAKAQIEKMRNCANCEYYQPVNDAEYFTRIKDGKHNGKYYRSCEFNLEKWESRQ